MEGGEDVTDREVSALVSGDGDGDDGGSDDGARSVDKHETGRWSGKYYYIRHWNGHMHSQLSDPDLLICNHVPPPIFFPAFFILDQ